MMDQREKLIELLMEVGIIEKACYLNCQKEVVNCKLCFAERVADYLLANGVVVLPCRCAECEYYIYPWKSDDGQVYGLCFIHGTADLKSTEFCSYAKRKGGDE